MRTPKQAACPGWDNLWVCTSTTLGFGRATSTTGTFRHECMCFSNCDTSYHLPAMVNKILQQPNQLLYSKDIFLQCFPLLILILCYNNTTQHIQHSTFNHGEAWNNLKRKLNITFYFRAKEIKAQEGDLPMMNYRHQEPTQVLQLQQCPVYRIISILEGFLKVYNHNLK